jgi:hypothetical protein
MTLGIGAELGAVLTSSPPTAVLAAVSARGCGNVVAPSTYEDTEYSVATIAVVEAEHWL